MKLNGYKRIAGCHSSSKKVSQPLLRMALTNLINVTHAKWQYVKRTLIFIVKMPYNGIVKNAHEDIKSGGANFFWKYPLILSMCCYPVPFYYHESKKISTFICFILVSGHHKIRLSNSSWESAQMHLYNGGII